MASPPQSQTPSEQHKIAPPPPAPGKPPIVLVETAFLASTATLLWLLSTYVPPVAPVLKIFLPIPIALVYIRWGNRAGWMAALVSGLLLSVLMSPIRSISFLIPYGILGVQLGACWRRKAGWFTSISLGSLIDCFGLFFRYWLTSILLGEDLWAYTIARIRDMAGWIFEQLGILAEPSLLIVQIMTICLILLSNIVYVFVVHLLALLIFERLGNPISKAPKWVQTLFDV